MPDHVNHVSSFECPYDGTGGVNKLGVDASKNVKMDGKILLGTK